MIKRANQKKKKGFSLIELIIVLAVMAIIALIAIPNFTAVRDNSKLKADKQSCETIKRTVLMLTADDTLKGKGTLAVTFTGTPEKATVAENADITGEDKLTTALAEVKKPQANKKSVTTAGDEETTTTNALVGYTIVISDTGDVTVSTN
ncbi:type II secretion system protein [Clostridium culturomicium]|uniref:type II secretion system protein n=1 Tax=Clostridium culturomicium TaxID=1499683 RepID=UPI00058F81A4|nr:type II secretion system protein [Clostridium culturomicium]